MFTKIYFGSRNEGKILEAKEILGVEVVGINQEVDEIQSMDFENVVRQKARDYFRRLKKPLFVEDSGIIFKALGLLPGTYTDDFLKQIENKGLTKIIKNDRRAIAYTYVAFTDGESIKIFKGEVEGSVTKRPKGKMGFGWDSIFVPKGNKKSFGQMTLAEKNKYSMRKIALLKMKKWLKKKKMI